jgi:hypothetical protein
MRANAATVTPLIAFGVTLLVCALDVVTTTGPVPEVHARARAYARALTAGDVQAARAFHLPPSAPVRDDVSGLIGEPYRIDSVREEIGPDGRIHVYTTLLWAEGSDQKPRGIALSLDWVEGPNGEWSIWGTR